MGPLDSLTVWLEHTQASQTIQVVSWIIPTVQTIHILAIAAVIGSMGLVDLRVLGVVGRSQSLSSVSSRLIPWVWFALVVLFLTGCVMIVGEPARSLTNVIFQTKMILVLTVGVLTFFLQRILSGAPDTSPLSAKLIALVSLFIWAAIVFAGRWIAYGDSLAVLFGN